MNGATGSGNGTLRMMSAPTRGCTRTFWNSSGESLPVLATMWGGTASMPMSCSSAAVSPPAPRPRSCRRRAPARRPCAPCAAGARTRSSPSPRWPSPALRASPCAGRTPARPPCALRAAARTDCVRQRGAAIGQDAPAPPPTRRRRRPAPSCRGARRCRTAPSREDARHGQRTPGIESGRESAVGP